MFHKFKFKIKNREGNFSCLTHKGVVFVCMLEQSFSESIANLKYNKLYCFLFSSACCFIRLFILLHQHAKKKELKFNCTGKIIFTQLLHLSEV